MKSTFLFPRVFNKIGWLLFVPSVLTIIWLIATGKSPEAGLNFNAFALMDDGILGEVNYFKFIKNDLTDELLLSLIVLGCILIGFSKRPNEDEYIAQIRYESLVWAVYFNFGVMLLATWFVFGLFYFQVMMLSMISLLLFFVTRFQLMLYRLKKSTRDEE